MGGVFGRQAFFVRGGKSDVILVWCIAALIQCSCLKPRILEYIIHPVATAMTMLLVR